MLYVILFRDPYGLVLGQRLQPLSSWDMLVVWVLTWRFRKSLLAALSCSFVWTVLSCCRKAFQRILTKQGIKFMMNHKVTGAEKTGDSVTVSVESNKDGKRQLVRLILLEFFASYKTLERSCCAQTEKEETLSVTHVVAEQNLWAHIMLKGLFVC